jgi:hypothetical protein
MTLYATRALNLIVIKTGVIKTALHDQHCFKVTHFKHLVHQTFEMMDEDNGTAHLHVIQK